MANAALLRIATTLKQRAVTVEEWDNEVVYIREMTALEMESFISKTYKPSIVKGKKGGDDSDFEVMPITAMINILAYCLVDEDGKSLFTKAQIKSMSAPVLIDLGVIACEINNLDAGEDGKDVVQEAVDNLKNGKSDTSNSNSPKS